VPPPPWHYVGDFLVVDYWADADAARADIVASVERYNDTPVKPHF
jgi:acetoacetate decarboxylase